MIQSRPESTQRYSVHACTSLYSSAACEFTNTTMCTCVIKMLQKWHSSLRGLLLLFSFSFLLALSLSFNLLSLVVISFGQLRSLLTQRSLLIPYLQATEYSVLVCGSPTTCLKYWSTEFLGQIVFWSQILWNPCKPDTVGPNSVVQYSKVSSPEGLCLFCLRGIYYWYVVHSGLHLSECSRSTQVHTVSNAWI